MASSLPHVFLMLSPTLYVLEARRDRDDVTLVAHTSSGRCLLLEGRNITIMFLAQNPVVYSAVRRTMYLTLNESRTENYSRESHK